MTKARGLEVALQSRDTHRIQENVKQKTEMNPHSKLFIKQKFISVTFRLTEISYLMCL